MFKRTQRPLYGQLTGIGAQSHGIGQYSAILHASNVGSLMFQNTPFERDQNCVEPIVCSRFREDIPHVALYGVLRNIELVGDDFV
jgi:hypothetical protein